MKTRHTAAALAGVTLAVFGLALMAFAPGCSDPYTMYQTSGATVETGQTVMVMPFMDTRTFLAKNDPHREDVGAHVRDIFTDVLREQADAAGTGAKIVSPDMPQPEESLSTAEVAEIGRRHGADIVLAGQVFSFNNTRAASIPPRAGMFVRAVSAKTGAILFVGDHYSAASVPVGAGNRDDQARLVAEKLVTGFLAESGESLTKTIDKSIASGTAFANLEAEDEDAEDEAPAVTIVQKPIVPMRPEEMDELPELGMEQLDASLASIDARAAITEQFANLAGDELAEDLWASEGNVFNDGGTASDPNPAAALPTALAAAGAAPAAPMSEVESAAEVVETEVLAATAHTARPAPPANARIVSEPMTFEQPRTYRLVDLPEDPASAKQDADALVAAPAASGKDGALRVLILPYHDRENPNNLIARTGGGEIVTTLYGTQLALDPGITLMWDGTGMATHDRLISRAEAVEMGRLAGADFVMRGQVVEFRRAQSVPSFYSAVLSTAMLAAQMFFAEMSGVDVATEVYRVSDGLCVMSRRDRSQQKYVVQAEKTVRRLAAGMAASVSAALREEEPEEMDPLIDELQPLTVLSNP